MDIQWYPGHMKKTRDLIRDHIGLVDLVLELLDARAPASSVNPLFDDLLKNKKRLVILNKNDLADPLHNEAWSKWFSQQGKDVILYNAKSDPPKKIMQAIHRSTRFLRERSAARGQKNRPPRVMVIGIPNVGKSSLINRLVGKSSARTGNKPGVTKGKQWIRLQGDVDLFDTPGILWPKFDDQYQAMKIAWIGSISDLILETENLALSLLEFLCAHYPQATQKRYNVSCADKHDMLEAIGRSRGALMSGGVVDLERASGILIDDFRAGRLGRISLEWPDD